MSLAYTGKRLLLLLTTMWGIITIVFILSHVLPGDPARAAAGPGASMKAIETIKREMGLDLPLLQQYIHYLNGMFHGNLGRSVMTGRPVTESIAAYLPASIELAVFSSILGISLGILLGVFCALRAGTHADFLVRSLSVLGIAIPAFWLALVLQLVFSRFLAWFPAAGRIDPLLFRPDCITGSLIIDSIIALDSKALLSAMSHLVLPAITLSVASIATLTRMTRASLIDIMGMDYVRTARSKGLTERRTLLKHVLRNGAIPIITITGMQVPALVSWAFLVEVVFAWPGIGRFAYTSISNLDYVPVMGIIGVIAGLFAFTNFIVDVAYCMLDPRIRY